MRRLFIFLICFSFPGFLIAQNIGIGTPTPLQKLHVEGTTFLNGNVGIGNSTPGFPLSFAPILGDKISLWGNFSNSYGFGIQGYLLQIHTDLPESDIAFGYGSSAVFTETMRVKGSGDIGIGTTTPAAKLHVVAVNSEALRVQGLAPYISFYDNSNVYGGYLWFNGSYMELAANSGSSLRFVSGGTNRMTIGSDGRISIGASHTPATGYQLSVNGKIICEEARVQNSVLWPDYVFQDDYNLIPIAELEKIIHKQKHLPNIPTASQVEKEGFELGDMNKRLLVKIEELTLYIIGLSKENSIMNKRIRKLEEK